MEILENTKNKISFVIRAEEGLINAIRRSCLEIPILAIDEIEFYKNDSVLYDEVIALRLGLIPLITPKDMDIKENCKCKVEGCSNCQVEFKLDVEGPCTVYSKDLKGKEKAVYEDIPIVELSDGQKLNFLAKARLGKGIEHTKFSPGLAYYSNTPLIEKLDKKDIEEKDILHIGEREFNGIKQKEKLAYDFMNENVEYNGEIISVKPNKEEVLFTIESWGQISPKEIMIKAIDTLKKNLKSIK